MKFSLYKQFGALNSQPVFDAFEESVKQAGHTVSHNDPNGDVAVIWSVLWHGRMASNQQVWNQYRNSQRPVVVLEIGSIQRGVTWKVGVNGVNRDAYFSPGGHDNVRANQLGLKLSPWRRNNNGPIIICTQHSKSQQWADMPKIQIWLYDTIRQIRSRTDRKIIIRPHPRSPLTDFENTFSNVAVEIPRKLAGTYDSFDYQCKHAWAVINWSSNPAIEAAITGIPVFVGPSSLAWEVANHSLETIDDPLTPDRTQWLNDYAHTEYTIEEISQGIPLKNLTSVFD